MNAQLMLNIRTIKINVDGSMNFELILGNTLQQSKMYIKIIKLFACCLNLNFRTKRLDNTSYNIYHSEIRKHQNTGQALSSILKLGGWCLQKQQLLFIEILVCKPGKELGQLYVYILFKNTCSNPAKQGGQPHFTDGRPMFRDDRCPRSHSY